MPESSISACVAEYKGEILKIDTILKNSGKDPFLSGQGSWKKLKKTGRGNCVAYANLFREIAKKHKVDEVFHMQIGAVSKSDWESHFITVIYEDTSKVWCQSNEEINMFFDTIEILKSERPKFPGGVKIIATEEINCRK